VADSSTEVCAEIKEIPSSDLAFLLLTSMGFPREGRIVLISASKLARIRMRKFGALPVFVLLFGNADLRIFAI
jgi:hypothetical protein